MPALALRPCILAACLGVAAGLAGCGGGAEGDEPSAAAPAPAATVPTEAIALATGTVAAAAVVAPTYGPAPVVRVLRDDHVATLEMDYNAASPFGQFWTMSGSPDDDAGFLVVWWPQTTTLAERSRALAGADLCVSPAAAASATDESGRKTAAAGAEPGEVASRPAFAQALNFPIAAKWMVTANRRVQLQPIENGRTYQVQVQRLSARGRISSLAASFTFTGGDPTRVDALRASLTHFDDFNLPAGAADEKRWNQASMVSTDPRFNLFFVNDQLHAHTLHGTRHDNVGDKSQSAQRFRKKIRIEAAQRRRIVFDMDAPLSPRSVWYLDLNPVPTELTGHASFFDEEGAVGLPAGVLRLRAAGQSLSVNLIDPRGAAHHVASVDLEAVGRQAVSNVRRSFDVRVGTTGIEVRVDGTRVINAAFAPGTLPAADYELLWVDFGYNTTKDAVPYFLHHWDNFGIDGPVVDARTVHNYVTRLAGTDYQKAQRGSGQAPVFTVRIPDDLRPVVAGARAEAWLVYSLQMGDYSFLSVLPADTVKLNGRTSYRMPAPGNNTLPLDPDAGGWGAPRTGRIKLADLVRGGTSPLVVGDNTVQFLADNAGVLNVHIEVLYPPGSAPAYTPPAVIHRLPQPAELPRFGPPVRFQRIGTVDVGSAQQLSASPRERIAVRGVVPLNIEAGNTSWAGWAPELMNVPVQSTEVWSTGGTTGLAKVEVFLRPAGSSAAPGTRVLALATAVDAPAPQGRYLLRLDSRRYANGDYDLFVQATTPTGQKSHPSYGDEVGLFDAQGLSGAYYPIPIRIQN